MTLIPSSICPQCGFRAEVCTSCGKPIFSNSTTMAKLKAKKIPTQNICPTCSGLVQGKLSRAAGRAKKVNHDHTAYCCPKCGCKM